MKRLALPLAFLLLAIVLATAQAQTQSAFPQAIVLLPIESARSVGAEALARVPMDGQEWVITQVAPDRFAAWQQSGVSALELGRAEPAAGDLWLLDFSAEMAEGREMPDLSAFVRVLWLHPPHALLQAARVSAESLSRQGYRLILLDANIPLADRPSAIDAPPSVPNPMIAQLVSRLTPSAIRTWNLRLSGEQPVIIGGVSRYLKSRYSWSIGGRRAERYVFEQLRAMGYDPAYASYVTPYGETWRNVVVEIRGRLDPNRIVLIVGHLDSISQPVSGAAANAPGADDNATGSAAMLAMAALLKGKPLSYSLRFVWFTGEEQGYWGSRPYVNSLAARNTDVIAAIAIDMVGYDGNLDRVAELHTGVEPANLRLGDHLAAANQLYGLGLTLERKAVTATRFSDHRSFWENGYSSSLLLENFFDGTDEDPRPRDRNPAYHTVSDRFTRVDFIYTTAIARMAMAAALQLAVPWSVAPTPSPTATPTPGACTDLVQNGGFEQNAAWVFPTTGSTAGYSTAVVYRGARSARFGLPPGVQATAPSQPERSVHGELAPAGASFSSGYQRLVLPAAAERVTLTFWRHLGSEDAGADFQRALLLNPDNSFIKQIWRSLGDDETWKQVTVDLTPYRGREIKLYFEVFNDDASAGRTWMYLDQVSVKACGSAVGSSVATPTAVGAGLALPLYLPLLLAPRDG